jgi:hypothetical protein
MGSRGKCSRRGIPSAMTCVCDGLLPCDRAPSAQVARTPYTFLSARCTHRSRRCTHAVRREIASGYSLPGNCAHSSETRYSLYGMHTHGRMRSSAQRIAGVR